MFKVNFKLICVLLVFANRCYGADGQNRKESKAFKKDLETYLFEPSDSFQSDDPETPTPAPVSEDTKEVVISDATPPAVSQKSLYKY